jgi:hypothetical protein
MIKQVIVEEARIEATVKEACAERRSSLRQAQGERSRSTRASSFY